MSKNSPVQIGENRYNSMQEACLSFGVEFDNIKAKAVCRGIPIREFIVQELTPMAVEKEIIRKFLFGSAR